MANHGSPLPVGLMVCTPSFSRWSELVSTLVADLIWS